MAKTFTFTEALATLAVCVVAGVGTYVALDVLAPEPAPRVVYVNTETVTTDAACAEATAQLAAYSADATATLDSIVYLYDQGVEYDASINGDNVIPLQDRLAYISESYVSACTPTR